MLLSLSVDMVFLIHFKTNRVEIYISTPLLNIFFFKQQWTKESLKTLKPRLTLFLCRKIVTNPVTVRVELFLSLFLRMQIF